MQNKTTKIEDFCRFRNPKRISKKRGQVSVFIILGIVMLLILMIVLIVRREAIEKETRAPTEVAIEKIPVQFQPVRHFVESCISQVAIDGLEKLGNRGGYIEPEEFAITAGVEPTASNAIQFSSGSELEVPYWFYLKSDNKCTGSCEFSTERPPLKGQDIKSIETQLSNYVDKNLEDCLNDFIDLGKQKIDVKEKGNIKTTTIVRDNDILFRVNYPLEVKKGEAITTIENFNSLIDLNLNSIYNLATEIVNLEKEHRFLEKDVLNLLVAFSGKREDRLPPMAGTSLDFSSTLFWRKTKVEQDVEGMLASYIQLLQVDGAANYEEYDFVGDELRDALYNIGMTIPLNDTTSLEVSFDYIGWPIYFDLNCNGEICQPESVSVGFISLPGLQRYNFVYDVSFPTLVTIYDSSALNNRGYYFRFFLEGNIRNNEVMGKEFIPLEQISLDAGSMLCDLDKRNSGDITVKASDIENNPLDKVQIAYSCAEESCFIGETDESGKFVGKFPICIGGIISYLKDGYLGKSKILDTSLGKDGSAEITLDKVYDKKIVVKKKKVVKTPSGWEFQNAVYELDNEQAILSLTRESDTGEEPLQVAAEYRAGDDVEIRIAPGEYSISIDMLSYDTIVIPSRKEYVGIWPLGKEVEYPRIEFNESNPYTSGGLKLTHTFPNEDLAKDNKIVFYAVNIDLKGVAESERRIEDLEEMNKIGDYSKEYADLLKPEIR